MINMLSRIFSDLGGQGLRVLYGPSPPSRHPCGLASRKLSLNHCMQISEDTGPVEQEGHPGHLVATKNLKDQ